MQCLKEAVGQVFNRALILQFVNVNGEQIATQSAQQILFTSDVHQTVPQGFQHRIAEFQAEGIVDIAETVDTEQQQSGHAGEGGVLLKTLNEALSVE